MQDMNRVMLALIASVFGIAGITFVGLGTLFFFDDLSEEQVFATWFGLGGPLQMWQTGSIFMIVCLLAIIANLLAFPDRSARVMDEEGFEPDVV